MAEREQALQPNRPPQSERNQLSRMPREESTDKPQEEPEVESSHDQKHAQQQVIDMNAIDKEVPVIAVEGKAERRHHGQRLSKEHIERIKRRHRRERFLFRLDMVLLIIVCMGGAAAMIGLQALQ